MFSKKKKKPQISLPSNFEHRVHTGFDKREGRYVGLPLQWASIVGNNQILKSSNRPLPLVDPSEITPTEILDLKIIVRPHLNNNKIDDSLLSQSTIGNATGQPVPTNGIVLPKTSHVARSNSLRSSSPPRMRRDLRGNANVPPSVPEEPTQPGGGAPATNQYPTLRRDAAPLPNTGNYASKPQPQHPMHPHGQQADWNRQQQPQQVAPGQYAVDNQPTYQNNGPAMEHQKGLNGNATSQIPGAINVHTDLQTPYFR